jgi:hypothetical protein
MVGRRKLRFTQILNLRDPARPVPLTMARDKFTILLLWSEFISHVHCEVGESVLGIGNSYDGLVIFSDLLSGDGGTNGDNSVHVLRQLLNDAYPDQITVRNYQNQDTHVGEFFADNLAGCVGRRLLETGSPLLGEDPRGPEGPSDHLHGPESRSP